MARIGNSIGRRCDRLCFRAFEGVGAVVGDVEVVMAHVLGVLVVRGMVSSDAVTPHKNGVAKITLSQGGRNQLVVLIVHSRLHYLTRYNLERKTTIS